MAHDARRERWRQLSTASSTEDEWRAALRREQAAATVREWHNPPSVLHEAQRWIDGQDAATGAGKAEDDEASTHRKDSSGRRSR